MTTILDPATWTTGAFDAIPDAGPKATARGTRVVSNEHPLATEASVAALRAGGSAADAMVAGVVAQCVVCPGTSTLSGTMTVAYHDAATSRTHILNAGYNSVLDETAPWNYAGETSSGRSIVVPGVIAG